MKSRVFAIPGMTSQENSTILKDCFHYQLRPKDLIAVDKVISTFANPEMELCFIHAADKDEPWNEIMLTGIKSYFANQYPGVKTNYALVESTDSPEKINEFIEQLQIDVLAFNSRRKRLFARIFNPGLAYKMIYHSDIPLFVTHV